MAVFEIRMSLLEENEIRRNMCCKTEEFWVAREENILNLFGLNHISHLGLCNNYYFYLKK